MITTVVLENKTYQANLNQGIDLSITLKNGAENPNCYWADPVAFSTIEMGDFVGSVAKGGAVNYQSVRFTPHGNGTHTECYGHISEDKNATIDQCLTQFWFFAKVISVEPKATENGDLILERESIEAFLSETTAPFSALIIRTLPNTTDKKTKVYTNTNPAYLEPEIGNLLKNYKIEHLLVDLPSVDKEVDGGELKVHNGFWNTQGAIRTQCSITELIFVPDTVSDGLYLLNLQIPNVAIDAFCSRPVLYPINLVSG